MSISTNICILAGRLTRDPVMRHTPSGSAVADIGLAVDDSYTKDGQRTERTVFVDVAAWSKLAEHAAKYLKKGSPVLVEGKLQLDEWTSKEGEKRSKLRVRAERIQFLESRRDQEQRGEIADEPPKTPAKASTNQPSSEPDDALPF